VQTDTKQKVGTSKAGYHALCVRWEGNCRVKYNLLLRMFQSVIPILEIIGSHDKMVTLGVLLD